MEKVILVDERDKAIGTMEKMEAHEKGILHRAFSVFIFNRQGELLMQQRAPGKYHSPGLWTNTCCSHPRENETIHEGAERRLFEEMGFTCDLKKVFHFTYYAEVGLGLIENEFDHVFFGFSEELPIINPSEVCNWKFAAMKEIKAEIQSHPELFTAWFRIAFREVEKHLENFIFSPEQ